MPANHYGLGRKMQLTRQIQNATIKGDRQLVQKLRNQLKQLEKKTNQK
tara:strand:- start:542 stop:685 length:144 start_codon:yes stop_codon:yes gene_type:complete